MKTEKLKLEQVMKAAKALDVMLQQPGIPYKKAYWFDRNRKKIISTVKSWYKRAQEIQEKFAVEIPKEPFVDFNRYNAFKAGMLGALEKVLALTKMEADKVEEGRKLIRDVFLEHETIPPGEGLKGVPLTERTAYEKEMNAEAEAFETEVEVAEIEVDAVLEGILQKLVGEDQVALSFMFKDESIVKTFPSFPGGKLQS